MVSILSMTPTDASTATEAMKMAPQVVKVVIQAPPKKQLSEPFSSSTLSSKAKPTTKQTLSQSVLLKHKN